MFKIFIFLCITTIAQSTHFITKVNETVHHNVILEDDKPWNPEMYGRKIILRNLTGSISPETFTLLTELEELYFALSTIDNIHPESFRYLPKLKTLQFSYNIRLPFLANEIFKNCRNLKKIIIGHNRNVEGISEILFNNLQNLTHIEVTKESQIPRKMAKHFFENSKSLESIKLHFSNITVLDSETFEGLDNLNFVSLVENELVEIGPKTFRNKNLAHLYLGWNKLNAFSGREFYNLKKLRELDISSNPLTEVNLDQIRKNAPNLYSLSVAKTTLPCEEKQHLIRQGGLSFHVHMDQKELQQCEA